MLSAPGTPWQRPRIGRRHLYPLAATILAQGAPVGLLALRALAGRASDLAGLGAEIASDPALYLYLSLATAAVMGGLGYLLGRLEDRLAESAVIDALTGLANRRFFERQLDLEVARARRTGSRLSLVMLDLDGFKQVNDAHGHGEGDRVLARIGQALRASCRTGDLPCRYGGEELAVICPATGGAAALLLAERLRRAIERLATPLGGEEAGAIQVTLSAGVAEVDLSAPHPRQRLLASADRALYRAKGEGRNRSVLDRGLEPVDAQT